MAIVTDLVSFLKDRLDEDEQAARAASAALAGRTDDAFAAAHSLTGVPYVPGSDGAALAEHAFRWDPARALREIEAKRKLLQEIWTGMADFAVNLETARGDDCGALEYRDELLMLLALTYADHPDYQEAWKP